MSDDKKPVDRAVDLLVYAPVGLALEARTLLPKLIERGREQIDGQVTMARMVGQFAVRQGRSEATSRISTATETARGSLGELGLVPSARGGPAGGAGSRVSGGVAEPSPAADHPPAGAPRPAAASPPGPASGAETLGGGAAGAPGPAVDFEVPDVELVGIPDYDSLAASQVIPRLAGLNEEELETVKVYETAKRGRKTILNKINQLQR